MPCGHFLCCKCLSKLRNDIVGDLSCPICRKNTTLSSILYAKCNQENEIPTTVVKGNYSSKINCIVLTLMKLIAEDPNVKVLIFSGVSISYICVLVLNINLLYILFFF